MKTPNPYKKIRIRQRILTAFIAMLFFSQLLTGIIFNVAMTLFVVVDDHAMLTGHNFYDTQDIFVRLSGRANLTMIVSISVMFIMAVAVTYFLSNSLTRPIEKLGQYALSLGQGNFAPNDYVFQEKELEELNTALNKSARQLGIYDSEQKAFFQNASHELRTPLMSIKCYAEGISFGLMDPKQASQTILQETDKLTELVADLLYISKIDNITTAYTATEANLIEIIQECAARQQALAHTKQIHFSFDFNEDNISYKCVRELISRAIDNLISNAIRYAVSEITFLCHRTPSGIIISVADDGDGIEPEILPHIFERFYKGKGGNTGIGLAIVKSIVDQLSGQITAENSHGGAVFTITLP